MATDGKKDYFELRIPRIGKSNAVTLALIVLLVFMAFALGVVYTRMRYLESGDTGSASATNANEAFLKYAKMVRLNTKQFESCLKDGKYASAVNADENEATVLAVNATPSFYVNGKFLGGAFPYESFKEVIDKELNGTASENYKDYSDTLKQAHDNTRGKGFDPVPKSIQVGNSPVRGDQKAKVTIIEYSDFQCPFCQRSFSTMNQIMNDYKGKVRLVYKHLPIPSIHPNAQKAAEASECAKEQNKFWEYHDVLFNKQQEWSPLPQTTI